MLQKQVFDFVSSIYAGTIIENFKHENTDIGEIAIWLPDLSIGLHVIKCKENRVIYNKVLTDKNTYSFSETDLGKKASYNFKKAKAAYDIGVKLIHVWEDQWYNDRLNPTLKAIITSAIGVDSKTRRIFARKCEVREVPKDKYKEFCDKYHTQLSRPATIRLGLYYEEELVQVASFSKFTSRNGTKAKNVEYDYEFIRGCEGFAVSRVVGGVSKLLTHFIRKYNPSSILCYSDFNFFNGKGYAAAGFELKGFTGADKFYIDASDKKLKRVNRSASRYRQYMEKVVCNDWYCCYGAGSLRFVWKK